MSRGGKATGVSKQQTMRCHAIVGLLQLVMLLFKVIVKPPSIQPYTGNTAFHPLVSLHGGPSREMRNTIISKV